MASDAPNIALQRGASELYAHAAYYEQAYRRRQTDVRYYGEVLSQDPGQVLELGAGSGRITLPLARAGLSVTAVDSSPSMLGLLGERLEGEPAAVRRRVRPLLGDMRNLTLERRFRWVIAPFNTILHLYTQRDVSAFLAVAGRHLMKRRGELVFDYSTPRVSDLSLDPERWFKGPRLRDPASGKMVRYAERFHYSPLRQVLSTWMRFEPSDGQPPWEILLTHRQFFPLEMEALLCCHGFDRHTISADFTPAPPTAQADILVVRCSAPRGRHAFRETSTPAVRDLNP